MKKKEFLEVVQFEVFFNEGFPVHNIFVCTKLKVAQ